MTTSYWSSYPTYREGLIKINKEGEKKKKKDS